MPAVNPEPNTHERTCVEEVLRTAEIAYLSMVDQPEPNCATLSGPTRPYVVPVNFVYTPASREETAETPLPSGPEGTLLFHTGPGRKTQALERDPFVCVSVTAAEQLRLGPSPCEDGYLYRSVVLEGKAVLLTDEAQRRLALRSIVAKYDPEAVDRPFKPAIFAKTLLYAVELEIVSFKERPKHR